MADAESSPPTFFSRIWDYSVVHNTAYAAGDYYKYIKSYNTYSKRVLETAESYATPIVSASWAKLDEYSRQPVVEGLLSKADTFGNHQLDKIEGGITKITEVAKNVDTVIHGTKVEGVLLKTVGVIDRVVDVLLPKTEEDSDHQDVDAQEDEDNDENDEPVEGVDDDESQAGNSEDVTVLKATAPLYHKLKSRISKESLLRLPTQTRIGLKDLAIRVSHNVETRPQLRQYVNLLHSASKYILATKQATHDSIQKGADYSKVSVDFVYNSLSRVSSSVNSLVTILKKLDAHEARASLLELSKMISKSKANVTQIIDNLHLTQKLKDESSAILSRAGDVLARPLEAGYTAVSNSDIAAIRNAFTSLESAVQGVVESFSIQAEVNSE